MHDPRVGRFFAVDPLFKQYAYNSPYAFSENRVIDSKEVEGLERVHFVLTYVDSKPVLTKTTTEHTHSYLIFWKKNYKPQAAVHYNGETYYFHLDNKVSLRLQKIREWNGGNYNMNQLADFLKQKGKGYVSKEASNKSELIDNARNTFESFTWASTGYARYRMDASYYQAGNRRVVNIEDDIAVPTATVTRVQTSHPLSNRISVSENGDVSIVGTTKLYITIDDSNHATYYYNKKGGSEQGASIISFKISKNTADEIKRMSVPQSEAKSYPDRPEQVDVTQSESAYGLPSSYIEKLQSGIVKGSGKVETP